MGAAVHGSSFPLAGSHLVLAGNQLEETQCAPVGSPPVRKYFPVSFITMCRELVTPMAACSTKALLKHQFPAAFTSPRTIYLSLILRIQGCVSCLLWCMVEGKEKYTNPLFPRTEISTNIIYNL